MYSSFDRPLLLGIAVLLASCGPSNPSPVAEELLSDPKVSARVPPPQELIDDLVGTWMPTDYCECLFAKRSAFACGQELVNVYTMFVERHGKDSLRWSYITTHEGGPEAILGYDATRSAFTYTPAPEEHLGHALVELRSMGPRTLACKDDQNKEPQCFQRVANTDALLNEALFQGSYVDENNEDTLLFAVDGTIIGLSDLDHFSVLTDFTEGLDDRDIVFLSPGSDYDWTTDAYHYRHDGDMLLLYPMLATDTEYVYRMAEVMYRLRRVSE